MTYEQISYLIMIGISLSYIPAVVIIFGVLTSISDSFYKWQELHKKFLIWDISILFVFWAAFTGITAMLCTDGNPLVSIAAGGLILVGAAPYFKDSIGKWLHYIGAASAMLGTQLYLWVYHYDLWYIPTIFSIMAVIIIVDKEDDKNWMWWLEILAFLSFFIAQGIVIF